MKFLVQNYSSEYSTQALYLARGLNEQDGHSGALWNNSCSLYDIMDKENPDYYITSAFMLSTDFIHYAQNHLMFEMKLLLNVDNVSQDIINNIENSLEKNRINCPFFFSYDQNVKTKKVRFVNINNAYDAYLSQQSNMKYKIDKGIIINAKEEVEKYEGSYHILSQNKDMNEIADIVFPESQLCSLYHNYEEIIVNISDVIPQAFFDAIMYGNKVYYKSTNKDIKNDIQKILRTDAILDYEDERKTTDFAEIKKTVEERHSSSNRIKTLLSQLPKD
jgi:hypothetical protein